MTTLRYHAHLHCGHSAGCTAKDDIGDEVLCPIHGKRSRIVRICGVNW